MKKYIDFIIRQIRIYVLKDKFLLAAKQWFKDDGDNTHRLNYNLTQDSVVFDLGGYKGEFAERIVDRFDCNIYIFEPVKEFHTIIQEKFLSNNKIKAFNFGLSDKTEEIEISLSDDGSSVYRGKDNQKEMISLKSIKDFINENSISKIDLLKINIEGGEFAVLPELLNMDIIQNIKNLQIQFHNFVDNAEEKREAIRKQLSLTHKLTYDYYFIWENWELNANS
ncbi:MAG: FkbM family methyltransferase [Arcobacteraceae bacterium]|jgi:FkbM family methyltransferase|nr:FkbM family methyltransferase [Arcobacteraceae bacterium]